MREAFDPTDPFDVCADALRVMVADLALQALATPAFAGMARDQQLSCLVCGVMTGLMGAAHSFVTPDGYGEVENMVRAFVADASSNALSIIHSTGGNLDG